MRKNILVLLVGNIGSGKSTVAKKLVKQGYFCISRDSIREMINAGNYVFNMDKEMFVSFIEESALISLMDLGADIVIDDANIHKSIRRRLISLAKRYKNYKVIAYVMPRYSKRICLRRRMLNPHGNYSLKTYKDIWNRFDKFYVKPKKSEGLWRIIRHESGSVRRLARLTQEA